MGRRWWQKEARRAQNVQTPVVSSSTENVISVSTESVPVVADVVETVDQAPIEDVTGTSSDDHIEASEDAAAELEQLIESTSDEDLAEEVLNDEEEAVENSLDAAADAESGFKIVTRPNNLPQNYGSNKKKKR